MEPSRRNQWHQRQSPGAESAKTSQMVRRGSTVRVRQRALQNPRSRGDFRISVQVDRPSSVHREGRRANLQQLLTRLGSRLSQTSAAERAALVREFVLSIEIEAERDASGNLSSSTSTAAIPTAAIGTRTRPRTSSCTSPTSSPKPESLARTEKPPQRPRPKVKRTARRALQLRTSLMRSL
jgi:hypothetical protein